MTEEDGWGQIVSLTDFESEPISLLNDKFVIGRALDCDLSLSENKLVSGRHCNIQRSSDGKVTLTDTSTNGTLLNMIYRITKGKSKELQHGDEFYIVYKKENPDANVGFVYQDTRELQREEGTQEYSPPNLLDATLEDSDCNYISPVKEDKKRKTPEHSDEDVPPVKRQKSDERPAKPAATTAEKTPEQSGKETDKPKADSEKKDKEAADNKTCDTTAETKEEKKEEGEKKEESSEKAKESTSKPSVPEKDDIEENLQCIICQEIMHDCVSLQPCMHSFCAGCYSDWMSRSDECPSCRKKVSRINKNHIVNNLIEAYLKEHPAKKRPEEDLKELDGKNKITKDMLYPKDDRRYEDSSDYGDTDDDDDDNVDITPAAPAPRGLFNPAPAFNFPAPAPAPTVFGFGTPIFGVQRAKTVCRQCPEYKDPLNTAGDNTGILGGVKAAINTVKNLVTGGDATTAATGGAGDGPQPGTSDDGPKPGTSDEGNEPGASTSGDGAAPRHKFKEDPKEMPVPPPHVCGALQNHVLCQCCMNPMPDFRAQLHAMPGGERRPQQCGMCYRAYCHAYWGCRKADCFGCLNKFQDMNFGRKALGGLILDNFYESEIFKDYIDAKGMSVKDVLKECCKQMDAGRFTVTAQGTHRFTSEMAVCYACGIVNFKQLALQYRRTIKKEDLPEAVRNRADCYWGSRCRTQKNKPHHAKNFNHICDQTRQF